ncbi:MAG: DUF4383 domain-containing protein [Coleofasciculus sp. S288]|nr:DUF4383 domain-containing protein [Coleofasciculus sp. S288]
MDTINKGNMAERYCALIIGVLFLLIGVAGFVPALVSLPGSSAPNIPVDASPNVYAAGFGYLFGLFPTNLLHNLVHCAVGLLGIGSYTSLSSARLFNRGFAIAYVLIAIMGLLPLAKTTFGLMPIFGNNVWFNALTAAVAAYFGFVQPTQTMTQMDTSPRA